MWLTEMQKEEEAFFFLKGGGELISTLTLWRYKCRAKSLGGLGGRVFKKKSLEIGNFLFGGLRNRYGNFKRG